MNVCIHTGHVRELPTTYIKAAGERWLFLTLWVWDEYLREDVPHKMRIERAAQIADYEPLLTPGRQMTVRSRSKLIPIVRHGVVKAEVMGFEILAIEFHNRGHAAEIAPDASAPAATPSSAASSENPLARVMRELEATSSAEGNSHV